MLHKKPAKVAVNLATLGSVDGITEVAIADLALTSIARESLCLVDFHRGSAKESKQALKPWSSALEGAKSRIRDEMEYVAPRAIVQRRPPLNY